jgi:hypothetical protein
MTTKFLINADGYLVVPSHVAEFLELDRYNFDVADESYMHTFSEGSNVFIVGKQSIEMFELHYNDVYGFNPEIIEGA